jgi:hypothetical protein
MPYYIQVTFDTEGIKKNHQNASQNSEKPTEIEGSFCYMVESSSILTGTSSNQLTLVKRGAQDTIRLYGASASNNFEDAIMIYSVVRESGGQPLKQYSPLFLKNTSIAPSENDPLPSNMVPDTSFYFLESKAWFEGKKKHEVSFALYERDDVGKPSLYGYFKYLAVFHIHREQ